MLLKAPKHSGDALGLLISMMRGLAKRQCSTNLKICGIIFALEYSKYNIF